MKKQIKRLFSLCIIAALMVSFAFLMPPKAAAADTVITKILTTVQPTPVALMDPSAITVATSTEGCYIISAAWYDAAGNRVTGAFGTETYRLEILVGASQGYTISDDCKCYLNNSIITSGIRDTGKTAFLVREYTAAVWAPTVFKHPAAATVDEGGWASFVVSAQYARDYQWGLQSPDGKSFLPLNDVKGHFPGVETTGDGSSKIMIYHIPAAMDGWKVVCTFVGAGAGNTVPSNPAAITVRGASGRTAAQTLTANTLTQDNGTSLPAADTLVDENGEPTGSVSNKPISVAAETAGPAEAGAVAEAGALAETGGLAAADSSAAGAAASDPAQHVHVYSNSWSYDARGHWHECPDDGARADEELHSMTWSVTDSETGEETGRCTVCGYTAVRRPANNAETGNKPAGSFSFPPNLLMWALCLLLPVDIALIMTHAAMASRRRTRRVRDEDY